MESIENASQNQQKQISELELKINQLQQELKETGKSKNKAEEENHRLQSELNKTLKSKNQIEEEKKQIQSELKKTLQNKNQIEEEKKQIQSKLKETETKASEVEERNVKLQNILNETEKKANKLQDELEKMKPSKISGQIVVSVRNGLILKAHIKLNPNGSSVNFKRSKYIISKSNSQFLGESAYEKGEPITSLQMTTKEFICKSGTMHRL